MTSLTVAASSVEKSNILNSLASLRAWAFLILLLLGFEAWAHIAYQTTSLFNPFNLQSIAIFTVAPLLLALGQTIVIISGGIDLSVGFTMGFAAAVFARCLNLTGPWLGGVGGFAMATLVAVVASTFPGVVNGILIAKLRIPPFIGTLPEYNRRGNRTSDGWRLTNQSYVVFGLQTVRRKQCSSQTAVVLEESLNSQNETDISFLMKALRYYGRKDLRVEDVPPPERCASNQVIVKISVCGVCGTDLHEYLAGPIFIPTKPDPFTGASIPQIIGHEFSGTIVAVGDDLKDYSENDRVSIQPLIMPQNDYYALRGLSHLSEKRAAVGYSWPWGGMGEYAVLNEYNIAKLPNSVSDEQGALVEPAAVAIHAVRTGGLQVGNSLLISGGGPIGAVAVLSGAAAGATIFVSEPNPARRKVIESWGLCAAVLDPSTEDVPGRLRDLTEVGVDVAIECVGHERSLATCLESVKRQVWWYRLVCQRLRQELILSSWCLRRFTFVGVPVFPFIPGRRSSV